MTRSVVVNYYDELHLDKGLSTEDLNTELSRLETVWKRREITNPEKAAKMSALIIDARKVFKTNETRKEYDISLLPQQNKSSMENVKPAVEQWKLDAINKAETERQQLDDLESRKFRERSQKIEKRKAETSALYRKSWIAFIVCVAISFLAFIGLGFAKTPVFLLVVIMFGGMGFLNFCDMYRNGNGSGVVMMVSILGGLVFCFLSATARYTQMGYSAASASATWKTMGLLLVLMIAVIVITRSIGKHKANEAYKQNIL